MPESRHICAWCKCDLGTASTDRTSHGICDACAQQMLKDTRALGDRHTQDDVDTLIDKYRRRD